MRYLVRARIKPGREQALLAAIEQGTLGAGSVAGDEYLHNMREARLFDDGSARWVEVCFCATPLEEERPYWEEYFDLVKVQDAHARRKCRDENGSEPWIRASECLQAVAAVDAAYRSLESGTAEWVAIQGTRELDLVSLSAAARTDEPDMPLAAASV